MPPKKSVELVVLLLDVNSTANRKGPLNPNELPDFDISAAIVDSILCRKIFSQSQDLCSVICFGFESRRGNGYYIVSDGFESPLFHTIDKLEEVKPGTTSPVTVQSGLEYAIKQIKKHKDENPRSNINSTIFLLSNLDSTPAALLTEASARNLAKQLSETGTELFVASPDDVVKDEDKKAKIKFMKQLIDNANAIWMPFSECKTRFGTFIPKQTGIRGMPFDLKLGEDINIKLQMYKKNDPAKIKHSFVYSTKDGDVEIKKHFEHRTCPDVDLKRDELDNIADEEFVSNKFKKAENEMRVVEREDLIDGYYYGKTIVPVDDEIKEKFKPDKCGKELKLIQFTDRQNILPQYILSSPRYLLPVANTPGSQRVMQDLVKEMLEKNVVAICRYAYNSVAYSRIVCLIPRFTKEGLPMFIHYQIPQGDDMRSYEFALLDVEENLPDFTQEDAVNVFINDLMLADDDFRPKNVPSMAIQHECLLLRQKALYPSDPINRYMFSEASTSSLTMRENTEVLQSVADLADKFDLQTNERVYCRLFGNRQLGIDPIVDIKKLDEGANGLDMKMEH